MLNQLSFKVIECFILNIISSLKIEAFCHIRQPLSIFSTSNRLIWLNLVLSQIIYGGRSKIESQKRYVGVSISSCLSLIDFWQISSTAWPGRECLQSRETLLSLSCV